MRVICRTVEAFVENLRVGKPLEGTVWVDETSREVSEHKIVHNLQASAVLVLESGRKMLLQYGEEVGYDYTDGPEPIDEGFKTMCRRKGYLVERCADMGLKVRPGILAR